MPMVDEDQEIGAVNWMIRQGEGVGTNQGYLASMTLRSPPRAANSPVTVACMGRQDFTMSRKIRLTAFS